MGDTRFLCSIPKEKQFLEKAVETSVDSPGMLEAPSHPRGGPGLGWGYFSRPTGDLAGRANSHIEVLGCESTRQKHQLEVSLYFY